MNYILREAFGGKYLYIRPDQSGRIIINKKNMKSTDVGDEVKLIEGENNFGKTCKDVWICSDLSNLIEKGKEISAQLNMELKLSKRIKETD